MSFVLSDMIKVELRTCNESMDKECWLHLRGVPFERLAGSYKPLYIPIGKGHTRLVSCAIHPAIAADMYPSFWFGNH